MMAEREQADAQTTDAALVAGWLAGLEAQFGDRLDDAARATIGEQLAQLAANSRALTAYTLANAQEPEFVFTARREG